MRRKTAPPTGPRPVCELHKTKTNTNSHYLFSPYIRALQKPKLHKILLILCALPTVHTLPYSLLRTYWIKVAEPAAINRQCKGAMTQWAQCTVDSGRRKHALADRRLACGGHCRGQHFAVSRRVSPSSDQCLTALTTGTVSLYLTVSHRYPTVAHSFDTTE